MAIEQYGYIVVFVAVAIESMGVPFPGETALIAGAVYAGTGGNLSIAGVIIAAAAGAIVGDNLGYSIGSHRGSQLLHRFAGRLHINERHLALAQRYFERHGDKTVFFGRFFAILRTWSAFLAGVHHMPRRTFLFWNALGGITWSLVYGVLGYALGDNLPLLRRIQHIIGWGGTTAVIVAVVAVVACWLLWRRGLLRYSWLDRAWERLEAWLVRSPADEPPANAESNGTSNGIAQIAVSRRNRRLRHQPYGLHRTSSALPRHALLMSIQLAPDGLVQVARPADTPAHADTRELTSPGGSHTEGNSGSVGHANGAPTMQTSPDDPTVEPEVRSSAEPHQSW
jgi:membrane protein DedA with SNARE-associated domain